MREGSSAVRCGVVRVSGCDSDREAATKEVTGVAVVVAVAITIVSVRVGGGADGCPSGTLWQCCEGVSLWDSSRMGGSCSCSAAAAMVASSPRAAAVPVSFLLLLVLLLFVVVAVFPIAMIKQGFVCACFRVDDEIYTTGTTWYRIAVR